MRLIQLLLALALFSGMAAYADDQQGDNSDSNKELTRTVMGNDMPDFQTIIDLPSLSDQQREKIKGLMVNYEQEVAPITQEAQSISSSMLQGGSLTPEQIQEASQYLESGTLPNASLAESKGLGHAIELKEQVKEKRKALWLQIQNVLTPEQVSELQNN
ncbi:MAG: hypothetical protein K2Y22_01070 [Candidatus Obscuribacterales bacterium]|nr:hypothetical protein [Candidatus Obscuribacterales bacterium]